MRELAEAELRRDPLCARLTPAQRAAVCATAAERGRRLAEPYRGACPRALAFALGAGVRIDAGERRVAGNRTFAEYDAEARMISVCAAAIHEVAGQLQARGRRGDNRDAALNLLIAHELYHHLEGKRMDRSTDNGLTVRVPLLGGLLSARRRLRAADEIAAHSFAFDVCGA
ncbi:MAG TPA: hypothetical protein VKT77_08290 [Chthonomonadaceae bacterium]|nr:hypothetical protein [Chthonomonadaceae bacterium]